MWFWECVDWVCWVIEVGKHIYLDKLFGMLVEVLCDFYDKVGVCGLCI